MESTMLLFCLEICFEADGEDHEQEILLSLRRDDDAGGVSGLPGERVTGGLLRWFFGLTIAVGTGRNGALPGGALFL